jgi:hypothetical protein
VDDFGNGFDRLPGASGGFGHDDADDLRFGSFERRREIGRRKHFAPGALHLGHSCSGPLGHVDHASAEYAIDADQHRVARLDQVDHGRLHTGGARATDGQRHRVLGTEDSAEHGLHLVHDREIIGIKMPDGWTTQGGQHSRMGVAGAGTEQHAKRRINCGGK